MKQPKDGWEGLKENYNFDITSGFFVFLLALPLSMGIAQASDFLPIYGLVTAMVGGIVVSFFAGSPLTIKGPAAGLIVIVATAVAEFGGGISGWQLTLGVIVAAGILQIIFGVLRLGILSDFFPLSVVHGMLAAIGIIIISKQIHGIVGHNPLAHSGKPLLEPMELILAIPNSFSKPDIRAMIIGVISLVIVLGWPLIKNNFLKKIPAPLVMLSIVIPLSFIIGLDEIIDDNGNPKYYVHFGTGLLDVIGINVSFQGISQTAVFIKYTLMFALVGSLESLLTVKAIDMMDPFKRKSNTNKDLIALGLGNIFSGVLGGLPMISEVARSSANVSYGARTRWANFFHGLIMLIFLLFAVYFSDLIPKPALSAMLIGVGIKLAHPKQFFHILKIGRDQVLTFMVTIIITLLSDLLIGIFAGILFKLTIHLINGATLSSLFKAPATVSFTDDEYLVTIEKAAVFSNFLGIKNKLEEIPSGMKVTIDFNHTKLVDASVMVNIEHFVQDYKASGGEVNVIGLDNHIPFTSHPLSGRKKKNHTSK